MGTHDGRLTSLTPQQYADYIATERREAEQRELRQIREEEDERRKQARDKRAEAARLAVTLPLKARWEQQKKDEEAAQRRNFSKCACIVFACVAGLALAVFVIRLSDFGPASWAGVLGMLAAAGGTLTRARFAPQAPVRPANSGPSYSRAPRSE